MKCRHEHLAKIKTLLIAALIAVIPCGPVFGWSESPHRAITRAALASLPPWQRELLGAEGPKLAEHYCLIPDHVFTDLENARFARMESKPGERYLTILHLPTQQPEILKAMRYFMGKAVDAVREGRMPDAARYMGTLCHQLEDYGSPSHTMPGDNMFTLLQQFLPATDAMKDKLMHGPIESGELEVKLDGYVPALLGTAVDEAAWRLMHRVHEGIVNARRTTIPIIQGLYAEDADAVTRHQLKAATLDAKVVADALHTILCLGTQRFEEAARAALQRIALHDFFPLEAASLYYPQSQFFSSPYWGHPRSGVTLAEGKTATPLRLRVQESGSAVAKDFPNGISAGMGRSLTYLLPKDVYRRFTVLAGLHADLGARGRVEFTVSGDGKPLGIATLGGADPAQRFDCDLAGVTQLQLTLTARGTDAKSNYAIWAEPTLLKKP